MFSDLRDSISLMFYWRWPAVDGEITAVRVLPSGRGQFLLDYRFSLGDGDYSGEARCRPGLPPQERSTSTMRSASGDRFRFVIAETIRVSTGWTAGCGGISKVAKWGASFILTTNT